MTMTRNAMLCMILMATTGCATLVQGTRQTIEVRSSPPGATLRVERCGVPQRELTTPASVTVSRKAEGCTFHVSKWGYRTASVQLTRHWAPADMVEMHGSDLSFGESFFIFLFEMTIFFANAAIDTSTGASYTLDPPSLEVRLEVEDLAGSVPDLAFPWTDKQPPSRER